MKKVFISYAHKDSEHKNELLNHAKILEREGLLINWSDQLIDPGEEWLKAITYNLNNADLILLLISSDFIASEFCWGTELQEAMKRHELGTSRVIPIILRPCDWHSTPFGKLQVLPDEGKPLSKWQNIDEGWLRVIQGLRKII